jgi:hypothetical protein
MVARLREVKLEFSRLAEKMDRENWPAKKRATAYSQFGVSHFDDAAKVADEREKREVHDFVTKVLLEGRYIREHGLG